MIPGIVISVLTFPGIIVHEFAHKIFCQLFGVKIHEVRYFRFGSPAGYVIHDAPKKFAQTFFITTGPFIVNTIVAIPLFFVSKLTNLGIFALLGIMIGMHAFPSSGDAKTLWRESNRHIKDNFLAIIGYPFAVIIWVASILRVIWFDLIYALLLFYLIYLL